ncbi:MAG: hypothetical protein HY403_08395 [Elusimicrobia bacterium]|nr:hypothetical protein [Elusimicrobiota bacterium]
MRALSLAFLLACGAGPAFAGISDPVRTAQAHYLELRNKGHVRAAVRVSSGADPLRAGPPDSPGYAIYDFQRRVCTVFLNPAAIRAFEFDEPFAFRFMIYHELAHCDLFAFPHEINALPGAGARANRMISDLVHLEFLHNDDSRPVNGYGTYHETYADVKAVALLLAEGHSRERVREIVRYRASNVVSFMESHDNAGVFERILRMPWSGRAPARLDSEARAVADAYIPTNFLRKVFGAGGVPFVASDIVAAALRMPLSTLRFEHSPPADRAVIEGRLADVADARQGAWREYARLARAGGTPESVIEAFFIARYGARPRDLGEDDAAVRRALEKAAR